MRLALVFLSLAACGHSSQTPVDSPTPDVPDHSWDNVRAHYGTMLAIAGAGATDNSGTNEWLTSFEGGPALSAELSRPHMAAADMAGNVYIADKEAHAIRKVTPAGVITTVAGTGMNTTVDDTPGPALQRSLGDPNGLFVKPDGTLYILDLDHGRIRKVDTAGTMTTIVTTTGIAIGRGLWVTDDETVYFASGNVVKKATGGTVTTFATGFSSLGNIAMRDDGNLLVSDRGGNRVYLVGPTGNKTPIAGNGATGAGVDGAAALSTPLEGVRAVWPAVAADGGGFFAGTHEGCQLWFIDASGVAHLFLDGAKDAHAGVGEEWSTPGKKVSEMRSVTIAPDGDVILVDDDRGFVRSVQRK
jgi:sugar lactone lactonase YvrE